MLTFLCELMRVVKQVLRLIAQIGHTYSHLGHFWGLDIAFGLNFAFLTIFVLPKRNQN